MKRIKNRVYSDIGPGDHVEIRTPRGQIVSGRVVMRSSIEGWVINSGGTYGTPNIVSQQNYIRHITREQHERPGANDTEE